jgi:hypothetical protein
LPRDSGGSWDFSAGAENGRGGWICGCGGSTGEWLWVGRLGAWGAAVLRPYKELTRANLRWLEAIGGQDGGHFQDAAVVVVMLQLGSGLLVDNESYVGVELQGGCRDAGGDWAFDGLCDGRGF